MGRSVGEVIRAALDAYVKTLRQEPGIVITSVQKREGRIRIVGFRDPLAPSKEELLLSRGGLPAELDFTLFYSLDSRIAEKRVRRSLKPPPGVTISLRDGVLRATGIAPRRFIERTRLLATTFPTVERYDEDGLLDEDEAVAEAKRLAAALAVVEIPFSLGSAALTANAARAQAAALAPELTEAAQRARLDLCISVLGHTSPTGNRERNQALSAARAEQVFLDLQARGLSVKYLEPVGAGVWESAGSAARAQSVTFRVQLARSCSQSGRNRRVIGP